MPSPNTKKKNRLARLSASKSSGRAQALLGLLSAAEKHCVMLKSNLGQGAWTQKLRADPKIRSIKDARDAAEEAQWMFERSGGKEDISKELEKAWSHHIMTDWARREPAKAWACAQELWGGRKKALWEMSIVCFGSQIEEDLTARMRKIGEKRKFAAIHQSNDLKKRFREEEKALCEEALFRQEPGAPAGNFSKMMLQMSKKGYLAQPKWREAVKKMMFMTDGAGFDEFMRMKLAIDERDALGMEIGSKASASAEEPKPRRARARAFQRRPSSFRSEKTSASKAS